VLSPWPGVLTRILGLLSIAALAGWALGQTTLALLLAALFCLGWQLFQLYRLEHWLRAGVRTQPPSAKPLPADWIWQDLYRRIFRLRQRSRKRKRKLSRIIKQFQAAAAAMPDGIVVLSKEDKVEWCNKACRPLLGLRSPQDLGLQITTLVRHPDFVRLLAQPRETGSSEGGIDFTSPVDHNRILNVRVIPYGKKQRLLLATDVSRIRRLERMRQDFVANVSHELRTPLTVINGYLETFLDSGGDYAEHWRQPLRQMQQQTSRMRRIIEDLLMLARLETQAGRPQERPVAIPAMLETIVEDAQALSGERGHAIILEVDAALWVNGCEQELRSAFSNLVFNAVNHTPERSRVIVRWYADAQGVHFEVEDDGEGIAPQHLPRVTERFYRVDRGRRRESGGTGLGLAIVKHVMNNHDGRLNVTSLVGIGSLFACDFPLQRRFDKLPLRIVNESR